MKLLYILIFFCFLNSCFHLKSNTTGKLQYLSSDNYNYQELMKKQYKIRISEIVFATPTCGTRAQAAELVGEVEELGTVRVLILCRSLKDIKENHTLCFIPISRPSYEVSTVYYVQSDLTEMEIQRILNIPTTFATLVSCGNL